MVNDGEIPIFRGHLLSEEDLIVRKHILNMMCHFNTSWDKKDLKVIELEKHFLLLEEMVADGLVILGKNYLKIPEKARPYVRNICMAFDVRLQKSKPETQLFSMTI